MEAGLRPQLNQDETLLALGIFLEKDIDGFQTLRYPLGVVDTIHTQPTLGPATGLYRR
jgi:hypothetical protein